jgi:hypothetical protein
MARKTYRVSLYQASHQDDAPADLLNDLFHRLSVLEIMPVQQYGEMSYQLVLNEVGRQVYSGEFKRYGNDDLPHAGVPLGRERELEMGPHEMTIERNHFIYYQHRRVLVWQENRRSAPVSALSRYLSNALATTVAFYPILTRDATVNELLATHNPKVLEFTVARPLNPELYEGAGDTNRVMSLLAGLGGMTGSFRISANAVGLRGRLLDAARTIMLGRELVASGQASKVQVQLEDVDHPIDLLADRLKSKVTVNTEGRYPIPADLFAELARVKDDFEDELAEVFGR